MLTYTFLLDLNVDILRKVWSEKSENFCFLLIVVTRRVEGAFSSEISQFKRKKNVASGLVVAQWERGGLNAL
jgi:hypothetical protein